MAFRGVLPLSSGKETGAGVAVLPSFWFFSY